MSSTDSLMEVHLNSWLESLNMISSWAGAKLAQAQFVKWRAVTVAQLLERSLLTPKIRGSNPNMNWWFQPVMDVFHSLKRWDELRLLILISSLETEKTVMAFFSSDQNLPQKKKKFFSKNQQQLFFIKCHLWWKSYPKFGRSGPILWQSRIGGNRKLWVQK